MSRVPFLCANVTRHFRSHDRLVYIVTAQAAEGCPHAPEEAAPSPTVGFRVIIDDLVPIPVVTLSLVVGKEIEQAKKIPMNE